MGLSKDQLAADEVEVRHLRKHVKALAVPALILVLVGIGIGVLLALLPSSWRPWSTWAVVLSALVILVIWVVIPWVNWFTTTYTFTDKRIITRRGVLVKTGHDLPLSRISNVAFRRGPIDQLLGCGTLVMTTAADRPVTLKDIPNVEEVNVMMTELLFGSPDPIKDPNLRDE